jgi:hypothetical protein
MALISTQRASETPQADDIFGWLIGRREIELYSAMATGAPARSWCHRIHLRLGLRDKLRHLLRTAKSNSLTRAGSAITSTVAILPFLVEKRSTLNTRPPGAQTSPTSPLTSIGVRRLQVVARTRSLPSSSSSLHGSLSALPGARLRRRELRHRGRARQ